jgi:DNA invertase Pin-like site-specific DNA recombinase
MGHLLGYARVSTTDQHPQLQVDALTAAGCYRVFTETASGARGDRPTLAQVLDQLRPGDTLVVWKLDRLGRSLRHLVDTVTGLADRGVGFRSLQEAIDTTTPGGKLVFHVFAALAEFEGDLIRERTAAGLAAARSRGRYGGRPSVMTAHKLQVARRPPRLAAQSVDKAPASGDDPPSTMRRTHIRSWASRDALLLLRLQRRTLLQAGGAVHGADVCRLPGRPRPISDDDPRGDARRRDRARPLAILAMHTHEADITPR